jgi:hypothetical protein
LANLSRSQILAATAALALTPRTRAHRRLEKVRMCGITTDDMTRIDYAIKTDEFSAVRSGSGPMPPCMIASRGVVYERGVAVSS